MTDTFTLEPTVLVRTAPGAPGEARLGFVTAGKGAEEALIVFRGPEDARGYQEDSGKHTAAEGFQLIGMTPDAIESLLEVLDVHRVAMPEPWTGGQGRVDLFDRENFIRFLKEARIG